MHSTQTSDRISTAQPAYGARRIAVVLERDHGRVVNRKAVQRHMREMGSVGSSPGPHVSRRNADHRIYPYRLRNLTLLRPHHAWASASTSMPRATNWLYVVAVVDMYTRSIVRWTLDDTRAVPFVRDAVKQALAQARPEIGNRDQGRHCTRPQSIRLLEEAGVHISMDGTGRARDTICIERFWRTVTYEDVYLRDERSPREVRVGLSNDLTHSNAQRPHASSGYRTPAQVSFESS